MDFHHNCPKHDASRIQIIRVELYRLQFNRATNLIKNNRKSQEDEAHKPKKYIRVERKDNIIEIKHLLRLKLISLDNMKLPILIFIKII
jgi:hypothetical protein